MVLLANVYEAFRDTCLRHYKLDPAHFYTSPGLAWHACLKRTGIKLELLTDPDMLQMFERGIRGGITQAVRKYELAKNKYMGINSIPIRIPPIFSTQMQTICMVGQCHNLFQLEDLNGLM